jgi:glycosyltransferase involved in cell wall biosynthesis
MSVGGEGKVNSQTQTFLSVVMATYNSDKYLAESIQSVLSQTFENFELIIVNDNSSDSSDQIIKSFAEQDHRIVHLSNDWNMRQSASRNRAIENAKGEFIIIVDSDDICMPERLERQLNYFSDHPECDVLGTSYSIFFDTKVNECQSVVSANIDDIYGGQPLVHNPTCMIKRSVFVSHGSFNSKYDDAEDYELWSRWFAQGVNFNNLPDVLYKKRIHEDCVSLTKIKRQLYLMLKINLIALFKYRRRFTKAGYFRMIAQFLRFIYLTMHLDTILRGSTALERVQKEKSS